MAIEKQLVEVSCPQCQERYVADPTQEFFSCGEHGKILFTVGLQYKLLADMSAVKAGLKDLQQAQGDVSSNNHRDQFADSICRQFVELQNDFNRVLQSSQRIVPEPEIAIQKSNILLVDKRSVDEMNEAFVEAGIAFGIFTLFFGVLIQELVSVGATGLLVIMTFLAGGVTTYFYYKGYQEKRKLGVAIQEKRKLSSTIK